MRRATVHFFTVIGAHATGFLSAGVLIGLAVPPLAHALRSLLMPAMLIPLVLALVRLDWGAFGAYARRPGLIALMTVWLLGFSPVLVWLALKPLGLPESLFVALVLATLSAPIVASAAISVLVGFDAALAVVAVVVTTALVPLTLPPLAASLPLPAAAERQRSATCSTKGSRQSPSRQQGGKVRGTYRIGTLWWADPWRACGLRQGGRGTRL
jgi:hypothetical protein